MKHRTQIALAALLLTGLVGCSPPVPPRCTSEDGQHNMGQWYQTKIRDGDLLVIFQQRTCETCGWTEKNMGE